MLLSHFFHIIIIPFVASYSFRFTLCSSSSRQPLVCKPFLQTGKHVIVSCYLALNHMFPYTTKAYSSHNTYKSLNMVEALDVGKHAPLNVVILWSEFLADQWLLV